jgi:hypothetical protein
MSVVDILKKYETLGGDAEMRIRRDIKGSTFAVIAKSINQLLKIIAKADDEDAAPTQGPNMAGMTDVYKHFTRDVRFVDAMKLHCAQLVRAGQTLCNSVEETTLGYEDPLGDNYWKKDLTDQSTTAQVMEAASVTIGTLSGPSVTRIKAILDSMQEAAQLLPTLVFATMLDVMLLMIF